MGFQQTRVGRVKAAGGSRTPRLLPAIKNLGPRTASRYLRAFSRFVKLEHSVFALPFAYAGAFLAESAIPEFWRMFWITVAMVSARSLAMALNRLLDADLDALNPRTMEREIPAGRLTRVQAWVFSLLSLAVLVYSTFNLPVITRYLWPVVVVAFVLYPLTKRWTWLCHLFLGATIGLGPVGAWVAVTGEVTWQPFVLGAAVTFWIGGFDIIYAFADRDFDREHGIHSLPADLGTTSGLWTTRFFHLGSVLLLAVAGWVAGMGVIYYAGVVVCGLLLAYESWIMRDEDLSRLGLAFMTVNSVVSVVFLLFTTVATVVGTS